MYKICNEKWYNRIRPIFIEQGFRSHAFLILLLSFGSSYVRLTNFSSITKPFKFWISSFERLSEGCFPNFHCCLSFVHFFLKNMKKTGSRYWGLLNKSIFKIKFLLKEIKFQIKTPINHTIEEVKNHTDS